MKAQMLAVFLALYATVGFVLSLATQDDLQYLVATVTAVTLAATLGAVWPVHRGFAVAGFAIGLALAAAFFSYLLFIVLTDDGIWYERYGRGRFIVQSVFVAFAIFGGWTFVVSVGAAAGWLLRQFRRGQPIDSLA